MTARPSPHSTNGTELDRLQQSLHALVQILARAAARDWLRENSAVDPIADDSAPSSSSSSNNGGDTD